MKTIHINLLFLSFFLTSGLSMYAQGAREKIQAHKIAFLTQKLNLNVQEAQIFWPVYNELQQKQAKINKAKRERMRNFSERMSSMSDQELEKLADEQINDDLKLAKLKLEYHQKFKKVLSIKKLIRLYKAERNFKNNLLKKLKERRQRRFD